MKTKILGLAALLLFATQTPAQRTFTVEARNYDISDNLDLRAVASIFAESRDLSDFEMRLNDARYQISNLDLNNDGWIDYLRVVETSTDPAVATLLHKHAETVNGFIKNGMPEMMKNHLE